MGRAGAGSGPGGGGGPRGGMGGGPRGGGGGGPRNMGTGGGPRNMGGGMGGPGMGGPRGGGPMPPPRRRGCCGSVLMIPVIIILGVLLLFTGLSSGNRYASSGASGSMSTRSKLTGVSSYDSDCVIDELGWVDDVSQLGSDLKYFFG